MHVTGDLVRIRGGRRSRGNVVSNAQNALKLPNRILRPVYSLYDKSRRKTRDGHSHTRVPRIVQTRNGTHVHTDNPVLGTTCDLKSKNVDRGLEDLCSLLA